MASSNSTGYTLRIWSAKTSMVSKHRVNNPGGNCNLDYLWTMDRYYGDANSLSHDEMEEVVKGEKRNTTIIHDRHM